MPSRDDDIETMSEGDLMTISSGNIPSGLLTVLWARHSALIYQRRIEELNGELSGAYTRHVMLFPGQAPEEKRRREEEEQRRYVQAMLDIQQRSDRLLAAIEFREREIEWHRQEIEDRALKMHDGRRVYFDGTGYRDETGRVLAGDDANEAAVLHHERPEAPTWQERQKTIDPSLVHFAHCSSAPVIKHPAGAANDGGREGCAHRQCGRCEDEAQLSHVVVKCEILRSSKEVRCRKPFHYWRTPFSRRVGKLAALPICCWQKHCKHHCERKIHERSAYDIAGHRSSPFSWEN
jgi:hypothetical protein